MILRFFSVLLCTVLLITAAAAGVARGQGEAAGKAVLCTGHGTVIVYVNAEGQPVSPPELCPDAAQALLSANTLPAQLHGFQGIEITAFFQPLMRQVRRFDLIETSARGPPLV